MSGWFYLLAGIAVLALNKPLAVFINTTWLGSAGDKMRLRGSRTAAALAGAFFAGVGLLLLILH